MYSSHTTETKLQFSLQLKIICITHLINIIKTGMSVIDPQMNSVYIHFWFFFSLWPLPTLCSICAQRNHLNIFLRT